MPEQEQYIPEELGLAQKKTGGVKVGKNKTAPSAEVAEGQEPSAEDSEILPWTQEEEKRIEELSLQAKSSSQEGKEKEANQILLQIQTMVEAKEQQLEEERQSEILKDLPEQYGAQKAILEKAGILEKLSSGELGVKGIDNVEYAFPTLAEINERIKEKAEILKTKTEQGFTELLIVPFGMKLDTLIEKYGQVILKHHKEGKLFATKKDPTDKDQPLALDTKQPVYAWDGYKNADTEGKLVYYPKEFTKENHQGKTKRELLQEEKQGFHVMLVEDLPNIPREGKGVETSGRKQLEAKQTPNQYLEELQTQTEYQNEVGQTPEDQIAYAIYYLEQHNQVIDDYAGNGSASYQVGAYFPDSDHVPYGYWNRDDQQAGLDRYNPTFQYSSIGARAGVRI